MHITQPAVIATGVKSFRGGYDLDLNGAQFYIFGYVESQVLGRRLRDHLQNKKGRHKSLCAEVQNLLLRRQKDGGTMSEKEKYAKDLERDSWGRGVNWVEWIDENCVEVECEIGEIEDDGYVTVYPPLNRQD